MKNYLQQRIRHATCILAACLISLNSFAQQINFNFKDVPLKTILKEVTLQTGYTFVYSDALSDIISRKASIAYSGNKEEAREEILKLLGNYGINYRIDESQIILAPESISAKPEIKPVKGKVTDKSGEPLPGVYVIVEGTNINEMTDMNGNFSISVPENDKIRLKFICMGMKEMTVECQQGASLNIALEPDNLTLDDIVVIGYGTKNKKSVTSSVSSIRKEDMETLSATATSVDNLLSGTIKGVLSTQTSGELGAAPKINVRGITSPYPLSSGQPGNTPLYVIDGVPMFVESTGINPLMNLAPKDIESIDVLKDAAATSIYGSRGANGVIIVNTKNGQRGENMSVDLSYTFSISNPVKKFNPLNRSEFMALHDEILSNTATALNNISPITFMPGSMTMSPELLSMFGNFDISYDPETFMPVYKYNGLNLDGYGKYDTNWENEILNRNAANHNYSMSLRGGTEKTNYSFSFNALNQEGLYINDRMDQYGARLSLEGEVIKGFKMGSVLSYSYADKKSANGDGMIMHSVSNISNTRPDIPVYDENGGFYRYDGGGMYDMPGMLSVATPLAQREIADRQKNNQFLGNVYVDITPVEGLNLHADYNVASYLYQGSRLIPLDAMDMFTGMSMFSELSKSTGNSVNMSANFRVDYKKNIDRHYFAIMAGYGGDRYTYRSESVNYSDLANTNMTNIDAAQYVTYKIESVSKSALNSFYGRISYDFDQKYLIEANLRSDASSKFGPTHRVGFFPAVSLGWRIDRESFINSDKIDNLKLRLSWGNTGSTNVSDFSYIQHFSASSSGIYDGLHAIQINNLLPNKDLRWEKTTEYNAGIDFGFFNGRLTGSIDAYYRYTDGALAPAPHILESGLTMYYDNIIDMSNKGIEFEIGADIIRSKSFLWNTYFNISMNRNIVEKLNNSSIDVFMQESFIEGMPAGTAKGYVVDRIAQTQEEIDELNKTALEKYGSEYQTGLSVGDYIMKDIDKNGIIDSYDRDVISNPEAKFFGGWSNTFSYKGISLSFLMQFSYGGQAIYSIMGSDAYAYLGYSINRELFGNTWTPERTDAKYAKLVYTPTNQYNFMSNDRFVYDRSYLRLKNITISYDLPERLLSRIGIKGMNVYLMGSNIFTISKWPGIDPDLIGSEVTTMSSNTDAYPISRTFSIGANIKF